MSWQARYYHYDGLGSTQLLTDENGNFTDSYCNTAFGEPVDTGAENPTTNPFRYAGRHGYYLESDTAQYYVRARGEESPRPTYWRQPAQRMSSSPPTARYAHFIKTTRSSSGRGAPSTDVGSRSE